MQWLKKVLRYIFIFSLLFMLLWAQPIPVRDGDTGEHGDNSATGEDGGAEGQGSVGTSAVMQGASGQSMTMQGSAGTDAGEQNAVGTDSRVQDTVGTGTAMPGTAEASTAEQDAGQNTMPQGAAEASASTQDATGTAGQGISGQNADEWENNQTDQRLVYIFLTAAGVIVITAYIATLQSMPGPKVSREQKEWPKLDVEDWDLGSHIAPGDWVTVVDFAYLYEHGEDYDEDYEDYEYGYDEKYDYDITQIMLGTPVISVQDVTMIFHISGSNASGIKEYLIQWLKRQVAFRELVALDHISFNVFKGEVVGVIGTNGSGKSTLLRIVSGALNPTEGQVLADRKKVQLLTLGTGFDMELSARENVYLNGSIIGYSKKFLDEHYEEIVKFAELEGFMGEKVKNFSSGMVSRLGFAIATAGDAAEILILDEVLSVGDEFFRKKSLARVKEMIHGGSTVLMVSHGMGTILEHCTKVVWIEKGKLQMVGEPKKVCGAYQKMNG